MISYNKSTRTIEVKEGAKLTSEQFETFFKNELKLYDSIFLYFAGITNKEFEVLLKAGYSNISMPDVIRGLLIGPYAKGNLALVKKYNAKIDITETDAKSVSTNIVATDISRIGNLLELQDTSKFTLILTIKNNDNTTIGEAIEKLEDPELKLKVTAALLGD